MSQFAPKRFCVDSLIACDALPRPANGRSCIIVNDNVPTTPTPISPPYQNGDPTSPDSPDSPDSPAFYRTHSYDAVLFDLRRVPSEKIAAQLTLIALPLFKAIRMEEFSNGNWTKKDKLQLAPNIVAFTRQFNHTSFWVVREILNEENARKRSEILTQFIKIAKKLLELNNLHSLKAVLAGLQSAPIHRLSQTWKNVAKRERVTFKNLADFLSDDENRKQLREHMNAAKLPCIPHLGLYLTDLSYLYTISKGASRQTSAQVDTIMNMIAYCQNSTYDELFIEPPIQKYLSHVRYIDELQKFFEDENYTLSLKREPDRVVIRKFKECSASGIKSQLRTSQSHEDLLTPFTSGSMDTAHSTYSSHSDSKIWTPQPHHRPLVLRHSLQVEQHSHAGIANCVGTGGSSGKTDRFRDGLRRQWIEFKVEESPVPPRARKTSTLPDTRGASFSCQPSSGAEIRRRRSDSEHDHCLRFGKSLAVPTPFQAAVVNSRPHHSAPVVVRGKHKKSHSLGTNVLAALGVTKKSPLTSRDGSPDVFPGQSRSLIDNSMLDETLTSFGTSTPTGSIGNLSSSTSSLESFEGGELCKRLDDIDDLSLDFLEISNPTMEGTLRRKVLKRNGRSLSLRLKTKCWAQLTPTSLLFYTSKPKPGRKTSKPQKVKGLKLADCRVKYKDPLDRISDKQFIITDRHGNHTKFTAKSSSVAQEWVEKIKIAITQEEERLRREVEESLIKL